MDDLSKPSLKQILTDDFNRTYWKARQKKDPADLLECMYLARQLIVELGHLGVVHDKLMDPEYPNKFTLEKKDA